MTGWPLPEDPFDDTRSGSRSIELKESDVEKPRALSRTSTSDDATTTREATATCKPPKRRRFIGWRSGVFTCAVNALFVFTMNTIFLIWAVSRFDLDGGVGSLYEGTCDSLSRLNVGAHLAINILSTLLLSASNYCMQCMSSPTRAEVDKAHAKGVWLDIGVPSVRNLFRISPKRALLWFCLGSSSIPLHLFYNSAVFATLGAWDYHTFQVPDVFVTDINWKFNNASDLTSVLSDLQLKANQGKLERLSPYDCLKNYVKPVLSDRRNLLLVGGSANKSDAVPHKEASLVAGGTQFSWVCHQLPAWNSYYDAGDNCPTLYKQLLADPTHWTPLDATVDYCLSERVQAPCKLQFNISILILVIVFNLVKMCLMFYIAMSDGDAPLVTMGDALRWIHGATARRWWACNIICVSAVALAAFLLVLGTRATGVRTWKSISDLGIGTVDSRTLISWTLPESGTDGIISNVVVANLPQTILSFIYLSYNGLFTSMLLASEWSKFGVQRRSLRVSSTPVELQRGTYFLQLPYRYALPLMTFSGVLHWMLSQSIYPVHIMVHKPLGSDGSDEEMLTCGFSPLAIFVVIMMGLLLMISAFGIGSRKLASTIPLVGSCSAAISAACHRSPTEAENVEGLRLLWGVTDVNDDVGHCAFSSKEVELPVEGKLYAGKLD